MPTIPKKSLLLRLGLAMAVITALAFVSMLSSVFIADTSEGFAAAINQAGTLRMQSYRIAGSLVHGTPAEGVVPIGSTHALVEEFEQRLESPRIVSVLDKGVDDQLHQSYGVVERQWRQEIRPNLERYVRLLGLAEASEASIEDARRYYLTHVDRFVGDIDYLVTVLELEAEGFR